MALCGTVADLRHRIRKPSALSAPLRLTRLAAYFHLQLVLWNWQPQSLNIYFVGNVQVDPNRPMAALGVHLDPRDAQFMFPDTPWIALNDGGYEEPYGFYPGASPFEVTLYNVIEHETAHYLGRFKNRTVGAPPYQRQYDGEEHYWGTQLNILRGGGVGPTVGGYPLVVPGTWHQGGTEEQEIWTRVYAGLWNNP